MSKVDRSTYQKVVEENKRLKRDIRIIVMDDTMVAVNCMMKWYDTFQKEINFNKLMKKAVEHYVKEHKDELPDFITNKKSKK